jgi:outer membrane protein OmpA-like peptidoglycan-associated protein
MKNRFFCCAFLLCFFGAGVIFAQSTAEEIELLLGTRAVTYAQASRFVLEASDKLVTFDHNEAFSYAAESKWLPKNVSSNQTARLDGVSLLVMKAFEIKGGLFYSLTGRPHYAYREMTYRGYIQGRSDPAMPVSGELLLFIIGRLLSDREKIEATQNENALAAERAALLDAARREAALSAQTAADAAAREEAARREQQLAAERAAMEEAARRDASAADAAAREEAARREQQLAAERAAREEAARQAAVGTTTLRNIYFLHDSSIIQESERIKLQQIANVIRNIPNARVQITGHTALTGTRENQQRLSLERAQAVAAYLVSIGACGASSITAVGYGAERPMANNISASGMAANRRVEITILED